MAEKVEITKSLESMLISAERYACGRRTYIVGTTVDYLISLLPKLSDWCVDILLRDMHDQQGMVNRTRCNELWGDDCDKRDWDRLIVALEGEGGGRMKDYVLREDVLRCVEEDGHDNELDLGYPNHNEAFREIIKDIPAADVVEVDVKDLRIKKAIQTLCEFYSTAKKSDYVQKPLAWALYQTWKTFDKMDGGVNDDNNI